MPTLPEQIIELLKEHPGLTDREMTNALKGTEVGQQHVNQTCRTLESRGRVYGRPRRDNLTGNYLSNTEPETTEAHDLNALEEPQDALGEDALKRSLHELAGLAGMGSESQMGQPSGHRP